MKAKFKLITLLAILATSLVSCNNGNNSTTGNVSSGASNSISNVISNEPSVTPSIPSVISSTTTPSTPSTSVPSPGISVTPSSTSSDTSSSVIEGKWQYFLQSDSSASKEFMRTPYIEGIVSSVSDSYYQSAIGKTGSSLTNALKQIVNVSGLTRSYDWSRYEKVDEDPNNANNVFCIYSRSSYPKTAHVSGNAANKWNREHSYPQSKISKNAAKDSNLIYADDWKTNNARGNYQFSEVVHNSSTAVKDSANKVTANYRSGSYFEPCDAAKGEVARATLYVYVMYGHSIEGNFSSLDLCLKWNREYPVTSWEMLRNNRNYDIQKNRNPFIDHPEFADLMFNK